MKFVRMLFELLIKHEVQSREWPKSEHSSTVALRKP
jgi:hypothetical protein